MYAQPSQANQTSPVLLPVTLFCAEIQPVNETLYAIEQRKYSQKEIRDEMDIRV